MLIISLRSRVSKSQSRGTSHPPGYPLYTIIVYLVTSLGKQFAPSQTPAYIVNITSCAFGSISSGLISAVVCKLTKHTNSKAAKQDELNLENVTRCSAALAAGLMSAFSPLMWQYNTSAEVFALHNMFVSLIVYVLVIYSSNVNSMSIIYLGAFICGLALTNQHTAILLIMPVVGYVFYTSSIMIKPRLLMTSAASFLVGISSYSLLPLLAIYRPHAGSWGEVTTVRGFIHHLLRRDYGTMRLYSGDDTKSEGMNERILSWASDFVFHQLSRSSLIVLLTLGIISGLQMLLGTGRDSRALKQNKTKRVNTQSRAKGKHPFGVWTVILCALTFYLVVFHSLANLPLSNKLLFGIHQRFWMHPNILVYILLGIGLYKIIACSPNKSTQRIAAAVVLVLPCSTYWQNRSVSDQSSNRYFRKYASSILDTLPSHSLLLINYDQQWTSVRYLQSCEGVRNDITSINLSMMTFEWWKTKHALYDNVQFPGTHYTRGNTLPWLNGGFTFSEFIDANSDNFGTNIFIGGRLNFEDPAFLDKYEEEPFGLVRRVQKRDPRSKSAESYRLKSLDTWRVVSKHLSSNLPCEEEYPETTWESTVHREFFDHLVSRSTYLLDLALKQDAHAEKGMPHKVVLPSIAEAAAWLELAQSWDTKSYARQSSMKKNLGLAYMNIVRSKEVRYPDVEDIFGDDTDGEGRRHRQNWWKGMSDGDDNWKTWATTRWKSEWEAFLDLESSKAEPGYMQIKNIYESVVKSSRRSTN